jgi:hypothetical protein
MEIKTFEGVVVVVILWNVDYLKLIARKANIRY